MSRLGMVIADQTIIVCVSEDEICVHILHAIFFSFFLGKFPFFVRLFSCFLLYCR